MGSSAPRNRRERRAQAREKMESVPLSRPDRSQPSHKTLLDIAHDRQLLNALPTDTPPTVQTRTIEPDGSISGPVSVSPSTEPSDPEPGQYLDIAIYAFSLTLLHFTFTFLVHHQYDSSPPSLPKILISSTLYSPTPLLLFLMVAILHPRSSHIVTQLSFAVLSVVAGCWLVQATNEDSYMAVMRKAPPLGTLWVWAIVEMKWEWASGCLGLVGVWGWWNGYTIW